MRDLLSSFVRLATGLIVMAVAVVIFTIVCLLLLPSRRLRIRACNVFGHIVGRTCLWLCGARMPPGLPEAAGRVHPAIYVSNHTSVADIFIGIWLAPLDTCGVAKKQVVWYPFFGQLYAISGHLLLDRANRDSAVAALAGVAELMRKWRIGVWMWPEGTRSKDGRLRPFKKGFAHLALATGLPVVPVVVSGAHRLWRKNSVVIRPADVGIRVLDPIPTTHWRIETLDAHVEEVHAAFAAALPEDQRPLQDMQAASK
jgi:1-acyl-sn-glycerol-3-phosphate acyltransferase